jgi:ankyrin repeat protein
LSQWQERFFSYFQDQNRPDLDALLFEAVRHYNVDAVSLLLGAGASPNATQPDKPSHTALGLAASGNQVGSVTALLQAGADVNRRLLSEDGVAIMPLTQALRRDPPESVALLLGAGASLDNQDPKGWTVMHIAAHEGAARSIPLLVKAGGDVNEKTPSYRRQTAFHSAVQSAPRHTIEAMLAAGASLTQTDGQGENACGWARFFKRSIDIERLVCVPGG